MLMPSFMIADFSSDCNSFRQLSRRNRSFPNLVGLGGDRRTPRFQAEDFGAEQIIAAASEHNTIDNFNDVDAAFRTSQLSVLLDAIVRKSKNFASKFQVTNITHSYYAHLSFTGKIVAEFWNYSENQP